MAAARREGRSSVRLAVAGRYYNKQGGVSNVMAQMVERAAVDFDTTVVSSEYLDWDTTARQQPARMLRRPRAAQAPTFAFSAGRALREGNFDLVHVHDPQVPGGHLYTAHSFFPAYVKQRRAMASKGLGMLSHIYPRHAVPELMATICYRRDTPMIAAVSYSVRSEILSVWDYPESRIRVIHNGVDLNRFQSLDRLQARRQLEARLGVDLRDALIAVFVGYEFSRKRLDVAIQAVAAQADHRLHLVVAGGDDPSRYREMAARLGIAERVHFLGHVSDVPQVLAAGDVFLFPTKYEAASLAILEAAAAGMAIVTTGVAMAAETLEDGVSALLTDNTSDPAGVKVALARLLRDDSLRARLGEAAQLMVQDFTWDRVWNRYKHLYEEVLEDGGRVG